MNYCNALFLFFLIMLMGTQGSAQRQYADATTYSPNALGTSVSNPLDAIDGNDGTSSTLQMTLAAILGGSVWQNLSFSTPAVPYTPIYLILRINPLLTEKVTVEATNNGSPIGTANGGSASAAMLNIAGIHQMSLTPTVAFNGITIAMTAPLTLGKNIDIYEAFYYLPPQIDDITTCPGESVTLQVLNPQSGKYNLYTAQSGGTLLDTDSNGEFDIGTVTTSKTYYVEFQDNSGSGVHYSARVPVAVTVTQPPAITPGTNPAVCESATTASLPYSATNSPTTYSIVWNATAVAAGFNNVTDNALPANEIDINIPAAPGTYTGSLSVKNAIGCASSSVPFSVVIHPKPVTPNFNIQSN